MKTVTRAYASASDRFEVIDSVLPDYAVLIFVYPRDGSGDIEIFATREQALALAEALDRELQGQAQAAQGDHE